MPVVYSPNMSLPVPIVGQEIGPQWATDLNNSLNIIDGHNHSPGSGAPITPSGLSINANLPLGNNNLINARSARFTAQGSPLSLPADVGAIYVSGVDLYYNDINGVQIRLTQTGSVIGTPGSITGLVAPASASYNAISGTFVFQSNVTTPANIDVASVIIRKQVASSNGITLQAPNTLASNYSIVLPALPSSLALLSIDASGNMGTAGYFDGSTIQLSGGLIGVTPGGITNVQIAAGTILGSNLAAASITGAKIAASTITESNIVPGTFTGASIADGSISPVKFTAQPRAQSGSSGAFTTTSAAPTTVVAASITASGSRLVQMTLTSAAAISGTVRNTDGANAALLEFRQDGAVISSQQIPPGAFLPAAAFSFTMFNPPPAGAHTYALSIAASGAGPATTATNLAINVYEL